MRISLIRVLSHHLQIRAYSKMMEKRKGEMTAAQIRVNFARSRQEQRDQVAWECHSLPWQKLQTAGTRHNRQLQDVLRKAETLTPASPRAIRVCREHSQTGPRTDPTWKMGKAGARERRWRMRGQKD